MPNEIKKSEGRSQKSEFSPSPYSLSPEGRGRLFFFYSTFDVGRWMFDVHFFLFSKAYN